MWYRKACVSPDATAAARRQAHAHAHAKTYCRAPTKAASIQTANAPLKDVIGAFEYQYLNSRKNESPKIIF
jgi:hypothetical protein